MVDMTWYASRAVQMTAIQLVFVKIVVNKPLRVKDCQFDRQLFTWQAYTCNHLDRLDRLDGLDRLDNRLVVFYLLKLKCLCAQPRDVLERVWCVCNNIVAYQSRSVVQIVVVVEFGFEPSLCSFVGLD